MFKPPSKTSPAEDFRRARAARTGKGEGSLPQRIEALSRSRAPDPPGKGIAMLVLGVVVLGALIFQFAQGREKAKEAGRKARLEDSPPTAPGDAAGASAKVFDFSGEGDEAAGSTSDRPSTSDIRVREDHASQDVSPQDVASIDLPEGVPGELAPQLALAIAQAKRGHARLAATGLRAMPALLHKVPEDSRGAVRKTMLSAALEAAKRPESIAAALEAAMWLREGVEAGNRPMLTRFVPHAQIALERPKATDAAILFLHQDDSETTSMLLEEIVASSERPLSQRVAAAHALHGSQASERIRALRDDPATPAVLRVALGASR